MKPGDRVMDGNRIGTVVALRPGSSVDVQFDDVQFVTRRGVASLKPVRGNPGSRGGLTPTERSHLPDSAFALPGRRFPIHDANHGRIALQYILRGFVAKGDAPKVIKAVTTLYGRDPVVMGFYEKHKDRLLHPQRAAANPRDDVYDPAKEQFRAVVQGVYESLVRKELGKKYNEPFVANPRGRRLDEALPEERKRELLSSAYAIATRQGQKYGWLEAGTQSPTMKGRQRAAERLLDPTQRRHAEENREDYERTLAAVRKSGHFRVVAEVVDGQKRYVVQPRPPAELVRIPDYRLSAEKAQEDANRAEASFRKAPASLKARTNPYYLTSKFFDEVDVEDEPAEVIIHAEGERDSLGSLAEELGVPPLALLRYGVVERPVQKQGKTVWEPLPRDTIIRQITGRPGRYPDQWKMRPEELIRKDLAGYRIRKAPLIELLEASEDMQGSKRFATRAERDSGREAFREEDRKRLQEEEAERARRYAETRKLLSAGRITAEEARESERSVMRRLGIAQRQEEDKKTQQSVESMPLDTARAELAKIESDPAWQRYRTAYQSAQAQASGPTMKGGTRAIEGSSARAEELASKLPEGMIERHDALVERVRKLSAWQNLPPGLRKLYEAVKPGYVVILKKDIPRSGQVPLSKRAAYIQTATKLRTAESKVNLSLLLANIAALYPADTDWKSLRSELFAITTTPDEAISYLKGQGETKLIESLQGKVESDEKAAEAEQAGMPEASSLIYKLSGSLEPEGRGSFDIAREMVGTGAAGTLGGALVASEQQKEALMQEGFRTATKGKAPKSVAELRSALTAASEAVTTGLKEKGLYGQQSERYAAFFRRLMHSDPMKLAAFVEARRPQRTKEQNKEAINTILGIEDKAWQKLERQKKPVQERKSELRAQAFWDVEFKPNEATGEIETHYVLYVRKVLTGFSRIKRLGGAVVYVEPTKPVKLRGKAPKRAADTQPVGPETYQMELRNLAAARALQEQGKQTNDLRLLVKGRMDERRAVREINHYRSTLVGELDPLLREEEYIKLSSKRKVALFNMMSDVKEEAQKKLEQAAFSPGRAAMAQFTMAQAELGAAIKTADVVWLRDESWKAEIGKTRSFDPASGRMLSTDPRLQYEKYYTTNPVLAFYTIHLWNTPELFSGTRIILPSGVPVVPGVELDAIETKPVTEDNPEHDPFKGYKDLLASEVYLRGMFVLHLITGDFEAAASTFTQLFGQPSETLADGSRTAELPGVRRAIQDIVSSIALIPSAQDVFGAWGYDRDRARVEREASMIRSVLATKLRNGMITQEEYNEEIRGFEEELKTVALRAPTLTFGGTKLARMFFENKAKAVLQGQTGQSPVIDRAIFDVAAQLREAVEDKKRSIEALAAQKGGVKLLTEDLQDQLAFLNTIRAKISTI
jgi:hypothetical protein